MRKVAEPIKTAATSKRIGKTEGLIKLDAGRPFRLLDEFIAKTQNAERRAL